MRQRCSNPNNLKFKNYGNRGIKVCKLWNKSFQNFRMWALKNGYKKGLTIDRINVDGNYEPSNCRWVTNKIQQNNRRNNHVVDGKTIAEWADQSNLSYSAILKRVSKGMSPQEAINKPYIHGRMVTINGKTRNLTDWSKIYGVSKSTAWARINRGWDPIKAVTTPVRKGNYRHAVKNISD
jgi:hypothetical protein